MKENFKYSLVTIPVCLFLFTLPCIYVGVPLGIALIALLVTYILTFIIGSIISKRI